MPFVFSGEDRKKKSGVFRRPASIEKKDSKVMNIFKNLAAPFSSGKAIKGSISYVALEVLVSKLLRKIMQMDNKLDRIISGARLDPSDIRRSGGSL